MTSLPIHTIRNEFIHAVSNYHRIVIAAPTGTGKSTQIPQCLCDSGLLKGKILVLQPRRLAARMLAARVAAERNSPLGAEVGYMTRFDSRTSDQTRICFITEGILSRLVLNDPLLTGVAAVVFDEFHERSIHLDMGIGAIKKLQDNQRRDLISIVMSATLNGDALATYLGPHGFITCPQRLYPVTIRHLQVNSRAPLWESAANALMQLLASQPDGDVLIFMPGVYEIRKTIERCKALKTSETIDFLPLYGDLPAERQDAVMHASVNRKVIVATNIAETSLTVPGVRHVIDSGLARVNRYDPARGLNALLIESISKDSAQQRAGRAGRLGEGVCLRLWSEKDHARRADFHDPEVKRIDLSEPLLELLCQGCERPETDFPWLTPPPAGAVKRGWELLQWLGAVDRKQRLTPLGKSMAEIAAHPRISRLLLEARSRDCLEAATAIAGILSERSIVSSEPQAHERFITQFESRRKVNSKSHANDKPIHSDAVTHINAMDYALEVDFDLDRCAAVGIHAGAARQAWRTVDYYRKCMGVARLPAGVRSPQSDVELVHCLLVAFPDHLARRRDFSSRVCALRDDQRGELGPTCGPLETPLFVALEIREIGAHQGSSKVQLSTVSEIREEWLIDLFPEDWSFAHTIEWNGVRQALEKRSIDRCLGLVVNEKRSDDIDPRVAGQHLAKAIREEKLTLTGWNQDVQHWIARVHWLREVFPEKKLPLYDERTKETIIEEYGYGVTRLADLQKKPLLPLVKNRLSYADQEWVEAMAPVMIPIPSGRSMKIKYQSGQPPKGHAKIQDLYGLAATPTVAGGRHKVLLEIQGPNFRPVQITDDLAGFWQHLYPQIKKELMRRYPKHEWR